MDNQRHWIGYDTIKLIIALILLLLLLYLLLQGSAQGPNAPADTSPLPAVATPTPTRPVAPAATLIPTLPATALPSPTAPRPAPTASALPSPTLAPTTAPQPTLAPTATPRPTLMPTLTSQPTAKPQAASAEQMSVSVASVIPGKMVQLQFANLPANVTFAIRMGAGGSRAVAAPIVSHVTSAGGFELVWVEILSDLKTSERIDVRIDNAAGLSEVTSFDNTSAFSLPPAASVAAAPTSIAPVINRPLQVVHVDKGGIVKVAVINMPANTTFTVTVGKAGSQGLGGYQVAHMTSGAADGWSTIATFEIPVLLRNEETLDLRLDSPGVIYVVNFKNINF